MGHSLCYAKGKDWGLELEVFKFPLEEFRLRVEMYILSQHLITFNNAGVNHFNTLNWRGSALL